MKSIAKRPPRQRLPESERRAQILRAAFEIASRDGLSAVTARSVAEAAGLSQGLVFFHFKTTDQLLDALVEHVTEATLRSTPPPGSSAASRSGQAQLTAFLGDRIDHLDQAKQRRIIELLVEAWVTGLRRPGARRSVREAAARYRAAFLPVVEAAIAAEPERYANTTAEALASMALSLVLGTAIQATIDPDLVDRQALRAALEGLLGKGG